MDEEENPKPRRRRRTNEELLAARKDERLKERAKEIGRVEAIKQAPKKRVRRTYAQIAADKAAEEYRRQQLAEQAAAHIPKPPKVIFDKTFHFLVDGMTFNGKVWYQGEQVRILEGTAEYDAAFDRLGRFIFDKSPDDQVRLFGEVRYAEGPWPGLPYDPDNPGLIDEGGNAVPITEADKEALRRANLR